MNDLDEKSLMLLKYIHQNPDTPLSRIDRITDNPKVSITNQWLTALCDKGYICCSSYDSDPKMSITPKGQAYLKQLRKEKLISVREWNSAVVSILSLAATIIGIIITILFSKINGA